MRSGDRIAVYADFDCDGIPGAAVLSDLFTKLGYENFEVYLPHRDREGYGFHEEAVEQLASRGVKLIITVDVRDESCQVSQELGADIALNARTVDPVAAIKEATVDCTCSEPMVTVAAALTDGQPALKAKSGIEMTGA